jgi:probable O-glycosylation ligase (exosortase A-associated)
MKGLLFTYALTYGGAFAALFDPYIGLLIYICFAILKPESLWSWSVPAGNYSRIIAIALLVGWALHGFGNWRLGRAGAIVAALVGFWLWSIPSAVQAADQPLAWDMVENLSKVFVPFLVGISLIDSLKKLRQLAWVILLSQGYLAFEFNVRYYTSTFVLQEFSLGGLDNNAIAITMVTSLGLAFFLGLEAPRWWQKALAFTLAILMAHVVLFSYSRGGMLAMIVTGFVSFLLIPKKPRHYLVFLVAVALVLRLAGPGVRERFTTVSDAAETDDSAALRIKHWKACLESIDQHPLTGVGPDHWRLVSHLHGLPPGMAAHCTWLQVGAEFGVPALACLVLFYLLTMVRLWPLTRQKRPVSDPWMRHVPRMVIASLIGFIVSSSFVTVQGVELPYYIALLGAGLLKLDSLETAGVAAPAQPTVLGRPMPSPVPMAWGTGPGVDPGGSQVASS